MRPNDQDDTVPIRFSRVLRPQRSSSLRTIRLVTLFVLFVFIPTGLMFTFAGAWPVSGFMGLEVLALFAALRINHHRGSAFEAITITDREFRFARVDHWGKRRSWSFQPQWLRVHLDGPSQELIAGTHGKAVSIGRFLSAEERVALAECLQHELKRLTLPDLAAVR